MERTYEREYYRDWDNVNAIDESNERRKRRR